MEHNSTKVTFLYALSPSSLLRAHLKAGNKVELDYTVPSPLVYET